MRKSHQSSDWCWQSVDPFDETRLDLVDQTVGKKKDVEQLSESTFLTLRLGWPQRKKQDLSNSPTAPCLQLGLMGTTWLQFRKQQRCNMMQTKCVLRL